MILQAQDGKFYDQPWFSEGNFAFTERDSDCDSLIDANIMRIPCLLVPNTRRSSETSRITNANKWMKKHELKGKIVFEHMHESKMIFDGEFQKCFVLPLELSAPIPVPTKYLSGPFDASFTRYAWYQKFDAKILEKVYTINLPELRNTPEFEHARYLYSWLGAKTLREMQARLRVARLADDTIVRCNIKSLSRTVKLQ